MAGRGRKAQLKKERAEAYREKTALRETTATLGVRGRDRIAFRQQQILKGTESLLTGLPLVAPREKRPPILKPMQPVQVRPISFAPVSRVKKPVQQPELPRDDNEMHIKPLPKGKPVRVYRVEVESFSEKFPHVNVHPDRSRVDLYTTGKPTDTKSWYRETFDDRGFGRYSSVVGKGKKTPPKGDPKFDVKFLRSRKGLPSGNRTFYNFGEPSRALHFYDQKSTNPSEIERGNVFRIKSFQVPYSVFARVVKDSVHEKDAERFPYAPINVDRKAPNQFGLPQAYTSLLEARQIKGSARVHRPERLRLRSKM